MILLQNIEMADAMRTDGKIYVVVGVLVLIFTGIAIVLFRLEQRLSRLEKQSGLDSKPKN